MKNFNIEYLCHFEKQCHKRSTKPNPIRSNNDKIIKEIKIKGNFSFRHLKKKVFKIVNNHKIIFFFVYIYLHLKIYQYFYLVNLV